MTDFTPTLEQTAIVMAATETKDNLLVSALAGAAKTSTLVLIAQALSSTSMLCLAFNKRIAQEMASRLPSNCEARTLNSIGHTAWAQYLGKRVRLDDKKTYRIVKDLIEELKGDAKTAAYEAMADIMRAVDSGKTAGYIPTGHFPQAKRLVEDDEFFAWLDEEPPEWMENIIREATILSLREALDGNIDFADQLLMPTLWGAIFPFYPLVLIDEAQDLSALNHMMLTKIAKKRLIAVGDECQSIYGFRGAHQDSMKLLKHQFNMTELSLTISFRCPIKVVEAALWRAPEMKYPEWADAGEVRHLGHWDVNTIPAGDVAIICRNNAPLFRMALRMLRDGRYPELVGNEIGKSLIKILKKLGQPDDTQAEALQAVATWEQSKLAKSRSPDRIRDTADCLRVFVNEGSTLGEAIEYANRVMDVAGPTKLMTGHKSKGLEFDTVFILDQELIKMKDPQDRNLKYVMQTRAKHHLYYVDSDQYQSEKDIEE